MKMTPFALAAALQILFVLGFQAPAHAQDDDAEADDLLGTTQCITLTSLNRTQVVDGRNILFYMKNGDIFLNLLPRDCPGLRPRGSFSYRTNQNRLCNVDIITVLQNFGMGVSPGASCGLGMFRPLDELSAEELLRGDTP